MFSKAEATLLKQSFWTAFGQYMAPVLSAEGEKINWTAYKTGEKNIYFKAAADAKGASIGIEIWHNDLTLQQLYFEQFEELKSLLHTTLGEQWNWQLHGTDDYGKTISRIYTTLNDVSIFKKEDWPLLISFFKPRLIALDAFWCNAKYAFEALR